MLTSWDYMWRSTPLHRREVLESGVDGHSAPAYPDGVTADEVIGADQGHGPLFHRRYRTRIRDTQVSEEQLFERLKANLNQAAPTKFARFQKVLGESDALVRGDEYVVRMPGPWDGPVRVVQVGERSFRLATLQGHLEAGQIEFRIGHDDDGLMVFEIESWTRSAGRLSNLLYHRVRMAKEIQAHMWISFLEGVVALSGGRMTGGVDLDTRRVEDLLRPLTLSPQIRRRLAQLDGRPLNYDPAALDLAQPPPGWEVDDRRQPLPGEAPGDPVEDGSFQIASRLIRGYEFADPSMVRAFYEPRSPSPGRDMLLELRALGLLRVYVGVRVAEVYDNTREVGGRPVSVFGWSYRTLEGHVEMGQMNWEVWKWLDSGEVDFHVHAVFRSAPDSNPVIRVGFRLLRSHERALFLGSTDRRMKEFTELGLEREGRGERIRLAGPNLTARRLAADDRTHDQLARQVEE